MGEFPLRKMYCVMSWDGQLMQTDLTLTIRRKRYGVNTAGESSQSKGTRLVPHWSYFCTAYGDVFLRKVSYSNILMLHDYLQNTYTHTCAAGVWGGLYLFPAFAMLCGGTWQGEKYMDVTVKLSSTLREYVPAYAPEQGLRCAVPAGSRVVDLAVRLGLPLAELTIVMINGRQHALEDVLHGGDSVAFFPAIGEG